MKEFAHNTIVVGSGAAALSAAERLSALGVDAAIVTEGINKGTSRNTGSDKQTYYKLTLSGNVPDSPADMAADLFAGQCVDGDVALCEAALSTRAFLRLCELGVPFPVNRYGEFVGYKTDHDPRARATSAGPLTSRLMTETLERAVRNGNPIRMEHWKRPLQEGTVARIYLGQAFAGIGQAQEGRIHFRCMLLRGGSPQ